MTHGYTLLEMLLAVTVFAILAGAALPLGHSAASRARASSAAAYIAGRLSTARFEAVKRSAFVAIQFVKVDNTYRFRAYVDGNRNGVLARDIGRGIDRPISIEESLDANFPGVDFGIFSDVTGIDPGEPLDVDDPLHIGSSSLISFNPNGSTTGGTVFVRGLRPNQFAIRVLGTTGRVRVMQFDFQLRSWRAR